MRIVFDHSTPFSLAHGGLQIQIEQTKTALQHAGVEVDHLRWWDPDQKADLIQYFGRPHPAYIERAHKKGKKVVMLEILTGLGSRGQCARFLQKQLIASVGRMMPAGFLSRMGWQSYQHADACLAITPWECGLMKNVFGAPENRCHWIPNGIEEVFFKVPPTPRGKWLVCAATIDPRKKVLELSQAAVAAQTPLWIVGRPYGEDSYSRQFLEYVKKHSDIIRYEGAVEDRTAMARIYREARGFVLLSARETRSLSSEEAAACECPLLLSDLPWAHSVFEGGASYAPHQLPPGKLAAFLRDFYERAPSLPPPPKPKLWSEVVGLYIDLYRRVLNTSS